MAHDFAAGCVGGAAGVIVGQPFDTVKVRLQIQSKGGTAYKGVLDCVTRMIKHESAASLYKGLTPPLVGLGVQNAIIFGLQGQLRPYCGTGTRGEVKAGMCTGALQAIVTAPIELAKIRLQIQGQGCMLKKKDRKYKGPLQTVMTIYREEGFRPCFRGMMGVLVRDIPATGVYFGSFHYFKHLLTPEGKTHDDLYIYHLLLTGGLAGMLSWALLYPVDVVKTRVQADGFAPAGRYKSYADCLRVSFHEEGTQWLRKGFGATMLRAFPVNAAILTTVTVFLRLFQPQEEFATE